MLRWKEIDPQPNRAGFKLVMSSLNVEHTVASGLETTAKLTNEDLLDEQDMLNPYLYDLLFGSRAKAYIAG